MKSTNTFVKLFGSVFTLAVVAGAMALNSVALGQTPWYTVLEQAPNPAVVTDAALRLKIVESGLPWRIQDTGTGIEMLLIPSGTFQMGASPGDSEAYSDESPAHQVTLTNAFYMGKTEVTQAQWLAIMGDNPSRFQNSSIPLESASRPVEQVSWNAIATDTETYQCFNTKTGFRLPTEAEWEFACRGGTTTARYGTDVAAIAWYSGASDSQTINVAGKIANAYGLYDMLGNVWEWCQDWRASYSALPVTNPTGPLTGTKRLLRGGGWDAGSKECRASQRDQNYGDPTLRGGAIGFRVVRTVSWSIAGVLPVSGASIGGTAVKINGNNFPSSPTVTFGGVPATDIVRVSPSLITAVTPAGSPGMAVVSVNGVSAEAFYYRPSCDGDLDNNGTIDSSDLGLMLVNFGNCYESAVPEPQQQEPFILQSVEPATPVLNKK